MRKLAILILLLTTICAFGQLDSLNMRLERVRSSGSIPTYQVNDSIYIMSNFTFTFDTLFRLKEAVTPRTSWIDYVYNDSIVVYRGEDSLDYYSYTFINVSNGTHEDTLNQLCIHQLIDYCDSLIFWEKEYLDTIFYANLNELPRINVKDTIISDPYVRSDLFSAIASYDYIVNDTICLRAMPRTGMAYNIKNIFSPIFLSRIPFLVDDGYGSWADEEIFMSDSVIFCGGSDYINRYIISFVTGEIRPYDVRGEDYDGGNCTFGALRCWYDDSIVVSIPYRHDYYGDYYSNKITLLNIKNPFDVKTVASYTVDIEGTIEHTFCLPMPDDSLMFFAVISELESKHCFLRLCSTEGVNENQEKGPESYDIHTYPNPFNSTINISGAVEACYAIYDIYGNLVSNIDNGYSQSAVWQPSKEIVSGVYIIKASTRDGATSTKPVIYVK